jgi:hypothetical protein
VSAPDLFASLSGLFEKQGPFVSIYLDTESAVQDAAPRLDLRWKDLVRDLREAGVDAATIEALTEARGGHELGGTRVLIASAGTVHFARSLPEKTDTDVVRIGPMPYLLPLVDWVQTRVPHVVVLTDRQGADILAYTTGADPVQAGSVDTGRHPLHKTGTGGWAEHRHQLAVEENWRASAKEVAETVERVSRDVDAEILVLAGDVHAVDLLRGYLSPPLAARVTVVDGSRHQDGSDEVVADAVLAALAGRLRDKVAEALADFAKYRDRAAEVAATHPATDGTDFALNAANGTANVLAALRKAQVGTLLIGTDLDETATVFAGPAPTMLAATRTELAEMGVSNPQEAPLVDVLLRAALGTGAEILLVPAGTPDSPDDGIGALLRYSDNAAGPAAG